MLAKEKIIDLGTTTLGQRISFMERKLASIIIRMKT